MADSDSLILTDLSDRILTIRINRPAKKNALTLAMYAGITDALVRASGDDEVRAVLITGGPACFTAGNDLMDFLNNPPTSPDSPVVQFLPTLRSFAKPLVAAVCGVAIGIGTTLLLHCDLAYAGTNARFHLPFVDLGLVPEAGSSLLLPQLLGQRRAAELLMLAEPFGAEQALAMGFVNGVFEPEEVEGVARSKALILAAKAPTALGQTKRLMKAAQADLIAKTMDAELAVFGAQLQGPEAAEALQAFFEKRKPDFSQMG
ncbi:MAG: enoyl-CoA hydratase [Caldilineaceae bacterium]|nr:enoyl-CoA hydratase [Caldilineaceae bacterium]HRJ45330.1 enoyl-CoA hydratase [Caldilineaceae bacterium]